MAEKELTLRMDSQEYLALRLHAVRQGTSVQDLVLGLVRGDVAKAAHGDQQPTRELAAEILQRAGIDPDSPEHQDIAARAAETVRRRGHDARPGQDGRRGAA